VVFLIATILVSAVLLIAYRSVRVLGLTLVPVASGVLAGIAAVSPGLRLGARRHPRLRRHADRRSGRLRDLPVYQHGAGQPPQAALKRIWPTLRLGVLTSVLGCAAMLFSGFRGSRNSGCSRSPVC
jgi:predicted exporter